VFDLSTKESLKIVYAIIPHGLAIAFGFNGVLPSIAIVRYKSEL
jgi:hypothetical protein